MHYMIRNVHMKHYITRTLFIKHNNKEFIYDALNNTEFVYTAINNRVFPPLPVSRLSSNDQRKTGAQQFDSEGRGAPRAQPRGQRAALGLYLSLRNHRPIGFSA